MHATKSDSEVPIPPNQTLYCRNLDDKVHQNDLIANLYEFFIPFGEVVGVKATHSKQMRGQAFVAFREQAAAAVAMKKCQGKHILGKPIQINYARTKSDVLSGADKNGQASKRRKINEGPAAQ